MNNRVDILQLKQYLGQVSRKDTYRVLMYLHKHSSKVCPFSVNELRNKLGLDQSVVSQGLMTARRMGLVKFTKSGKHRFYWADTTRIDRFERQIHNTLSRYK